MQNQKSQVNLTEGDKNIQSLYSARSNALELAHMGRLFEDVEISWFATDRKAPVAPYEELIEGYHSLSEFERQQAETAVDEYMTEPEAEQFAAYLRFMEKPRFGPMFLKQFMPPLVGRHFNKYTGEFDACMTTSDYPIGGDAFIYCAASARDKLLPISVHGFYQVGGCKQISDDSSIPF